MVVIGKRIDGATGKQRETERETETETERERGRGMFTELAKDNSFYGLVPGNS